VPDFLATSVLEDAGKGVSSAAEDNIIPLVYVLQSNSHQVNKRDPDYIEGAESGDLWLRGSGLPPIKGDEGILVQPCYFYRNFVEWRLPRGSGMAGVHDTMPADAKPAPSPENPEKIIMLRPNGNQVVDTRNHIVRVYHPAGKVMSYSIPLSSTGHTSSRNWMTLMNMKVTNGRKAPSWAGLYRIKTKSRTNKSGTWNVLDVTDEGWVETVEDYNAGKDLYEAFVKGEKVVEAPSEDFNDSPHEDADAPM